MTSKEKLQEVWDLIHNKYPDTNEEIQKVRYAVKRAMELDEKDTPIKVIKEADKKYVDTYEFYERDIYRCGSCKKVLIKKLLIFNRHRNLQDNEKTNYCYHCGQKLKW